MLMLHFFLGLYQIKTGKQWINQYIYRIMEKSLYAEHIKQKWWLPMWLIMSYKKGATRHKWKFSSTTPNLKRDIRYFFNENIIWIFKNKTKRKIHCKHLQQIFNFNNKHLNTTWIALKMRWMKAQSTTTHDKNRSRIIIQNKRLVANIPLSRSE